MFRFGSPENLYLLLLLPALLLIVLIARHRSKKRLYAMAESHLLQSIIPDYSSMKQWLGTISLLLGLGFLIIALARPQFGTKLEEVKAVGSDIIVAVDVSNSMLAEDLQPNRLMRARNSIEKLISELKGDRLGLVVFAGKSFLQLPLTTDYSAARLMLSNLSTELVNTQGTAIGAAIETAIEAFPEEGEAGRTLIVITDGENHEDNAIKAAESAKESGITVHTIGMGKPEGAPIPIPGRQNTFIKDESGNTVITKLDENALRQIATEGGGSFVRVSGGTPDLQAIIEGVESKETEEFGSKKFTEYEDQYQYPLLLGLILLLIDPALTNRKGKIQKAIKEVTN